MIRPRYFSFGSGCYITFVILLCFPVQLFGQWVEKSGNGWLQLSLYHHDTRDRFDEEGNVEPLFNEDGRSITTSLFLTGVFGVYRGIDVWAQLPVHRLAFNDVSAKRERFGFGDPLLHVRLGPGLFNIKTPVAFAIRGGVKIPAGEFPVDAEIVPLTEGQRDWELMLEVGHSFYPRSIYAMGWVGYRWRETNFDIDSKPGDERFAFLVVGGGRGKFSWKFVAVGVSGKKWISLTAVRIPLSMSERRLIQLMPSVGWAMAQGTVELGGRIPVAGQNLPAGPALFVGYFLRVGRK